VGVLFIRSVAAMATVESRTCECRFGLLSSWASLTRLQKWQTSPLWPRPRWRKLPFFAHARPHEPRERLDSSSVSTLSQLRARKVGVCCNSFLLEVPHSGVVYHPMC